MTGAGSDGRPLLRTDQIYSSLYGFDVNGVGDQTFTWQPDERTWYFLSVTYSTADKEIRLSVNNAFQETITCPSCTVPITMDAGRLGAWYWPNSATPSRSMNGEISTFRVWNVATDGKDGCPGVGTNGLLINYMFIATSDNVQVDLSGSGNDGELHDAQWNSFLPDGQQCKSMTALGIAGDRTGASGCFVVIGRQAGEDDVDILSKFFTLTGTLTTSNVDGLIYHAIQTSLDSHPGAPNQLPGDNWLTLEVVNDGGVGKLRASMALCPMTGGGAARGASTAQFIFDKVINDGQPHTFMLEKGSPGTSLGRGCISLTVDGESQEQCNEECGNLESDTMWFGGVGEDFNRFHQSADQDVALFGGGGGVWQSHWDPTWDDDAMLSVGNFKGSLDNLQWSLAQGVRGRSGNVEVNDVDVTGDGAVCGGGGCQPQNVIILGKDAGQDSIDIGNQFFTLTGTLQTTKTDGLIFHGIHTEVHSGCNPCMPGDNAMTLEIIRDNGLGKLRGYIALCSITGGNAANDASKAIVIHPTIVSDGQPHDFIYEKGSPGTNLAPGCVALNVDGGTEESACNSECSWAESDTLYFGGVPLSFNRFHQSADQSAALFNGGGATWQSNWDESWDDDAIISTYNFQGELTNLKYSFKLGQRDRAQHGNVVDVDWSSGATCAGEVGGVDYTEVPPSAYTLTGSAKLDAGDTVLSITQVANSQAGAAFAEVPITQNEKVSIRFEFYCGDGTGADGLCMNLGSNNLGGRVGEDGVNAGVAVCFDEWANGGDHGVMMYYNMQNIWQDIGTCNNRQGCLPVSLFEDATWHSVEVNIIPVDNGAFVGMDMDNGRYGGAGNIVGGYALPSPAYLGFTGRTGGATNNHWARSIFYGKPARATGSGWPWVNCQGDCTGKFSVTVDNRNTAYINGDEVGRGSSWQVVKDYEFNVPNEDKIVFAIDAVDAELNVGGGVGAALAEVTIAGQKFGSDDTWKCFRPADDSTVGAEGHGVAAPDGWATKEFDDTGWDNCEMHSGFEDSRWGYGPLDSGNGQNNIWRFVFGQANPGISEDTAHWIWTKDHDAHNDVFIRFVVQLGTTPPTSDATGRVASTDINGDGIVDVTDVSDQLRLLLLAQNMPADCAAFARSCWLSSRRSTRTLAATPTVMGRRT